VIFLYKKSNQKNQFRQFERHWGSRKYLAFLILTTTVIFFSFVLKKIPRKFLAFLILTTTGIVFLISLEKTIFLFP